MLAYFCVTGYMLGYACSSVYDVLLLYLFCYACICMHHFCVCVRVGSRILAPGWWVLELRSSILGDPTQFQYP